MAAARGRFANTVISEIRGVTDEQGNSPFWDSLGRHFFSMDFDRADRLTSMTNKAFIADLMPQYPVYVPLLSEEAQDVIGVPHDDAILPYSLLEDEGFHPQGYIDIFDGGPTLECQARMIRTVRDSLTVMVAISDEPGTEGDTWLVSNDRLEDFRAMQVMATPRTQGAEVPVLALTSAQAAVLGVTAGDSLRAVLAISTR